MFFIMLVCYSVFMYTLGLSSSTSACSVCSLATDHLCTSKSEGCCASAPQLEAQFNTSGRNKASTSCLKIEQERPFQCYATSEKKPIITWQQLKCCDILHRCPSAWMSPVMRLGDKNTRASSRPSWLPRRPRVSRETREL